MPEIGIEQPISLVKEPVLSFPKHVTEKWMGSPFDELRKHLLPPDSEQTVQLESKISIEEMKQMFEIKSEEHTFIANAESKGGSYFETEFKNLQTQWENTSAEDTKTQKTLINKSCALGLAVYKESYPDIDVWDTQRVALIRMANNFLDTKTDGLVVNLPTGMGKTSVLIPTIIPTALMVCGHVDVTNLTPVSRRESFDRFTPMAHHLGLTISEVSDRSEILSKTGRRKYMDGNGGKHSASEKSDVSFSLPEEQGFQLMTDIFKYPNPVLHTKGCSIRDESDRLRVEEFTNPMVVAGNEEPAETVLTRYWNVFTPALSNDGYRQYLTRTLNAFIPDYPIHDAGEKAKALIMAFGEKAMWQMDGLDKYQKFSMKRTTTLPLNSLLTDDPHMEITQTEIKLMEKYFKAAHEQPLRDPDDNKPYRESDGTITREGEDDIFRRLWLDIEKRPYDSKQMIPKEWRNFFAELFPPQVYEAMQTAMSLTRDKHYFLNQTSIGVSSEYTNWPQLGKEFFPLVQVALYTKETARGANLTMPETLHETTSTIHQLIVNKLLYAKSMEFTGTGTSVTAWLRKAQNLDISRIPPEFETAREEKTIGCKQRNKDTHVLALLNDYEKQDSPPVLISAPKREDVYRLKNLIHEQFPESEIQILTPDNANQAKEIVAKAGNKHTITIVLGGMATREVDVLVSKDLDSAGGLHVIACAPLLDPRNDAQFAGRAARAGRKGTYVRLVSITDEVFSRFSDKEKVQIKKDIYSRDTKNINQWIKKGQEGTDERTLFSAEQYIALTKPYIKVWQELLALPLEKRETFEPIWGDFLQIVDTQGKFLFSTNYIFRTKPPSQQAHLWDTLVQNAFVKFSTLVQTENIKDQQNTIVKDLNDYFSTELGSI
jgi:preprotein translocase subunit SecA